MTGAEPRRVRAFGDHGLLVDLGDVTEVLGLAAALRDRPPAAVTEIVPAAASLLVLLDESSTAAEIASCRTDLGTRPVTGPAPAEESAVTVEVLYDGADLDEVGVLTGLGADGVVAAHTGQLWTVAFGGFAPGFGYLVGSDDRLAVPRRASPRTRVPAGAVGLAGPFSGIYPRESPGGWQLLGRTAVVLWDTDRDPPALLRPGMRVRSGRSRNSGPCPGRDSAPGPNRSHSPPAAPTVGW